MTCPDFLLVDQPYPGLERLKARFRGHAYDPHRHETYAIGLTEYGMQAFRYRGAERTSTAGKTLVIHPDESHDGHAGEATGFAYRMLYIDPALIRSARTDYPSSPFVPDVVADDPDLADALTEAFEGFPGPLAPLAAASLIARLADALWRRSDHKVGRTPRSNDIAAIKRACAFLDAATEISVSSEDLERETGVDRYVLARSFRAQLGTSPHRYLIARRLLRVRSAIADGIPLAEAAVAAGFADQSHMTRHFHTHFGITPGRYAKLLRNGR
jgi:AraC-like DNA-binding protein